MRSTVVIAAALSLLAAGCGYVGDPKPPALGIPLRIQDLTVTQRGGTVFVQFTPSLQSTDGLVLKELSGFDLRAGGPNPGNFHTASWADLAERLPLSGASVEPVVAEFPAAKWAGREVFFGVRALGPAGRASDWSNIAVLSVVAPPPRPLSLRAENHPKGVGLGWERTDLPEGGAWQVFRRTGDDNDAASLGRTRDPFWLDTNAELGKKYKYTVVTMTPAGSGEAASDPADEATIVPADVFAPDPPSGFEALQSLNTIELTWKRGTEADLRAWQVWRAEGAAALAKLGEPVAIPSFSDGKIEPGTTYRYAVSSIDEAGNESKPCAPVEVKAP
jgi:hypothetical protein